MTVALLLARQALRRHTLSWLVIGLTVMIAGAVALGCFAGARRTASTHERYLAATAGSDLTYESQPTCDDRPCTVDDFAAIDGVAAVEERLRLIPGLENPDGSLSEDINNTGITGLTPGHEWTVDRPLLTAGRLPDVNATDEALVTPAFAAAHNLRVGDEIGIRSFTLDDIPALQEEANGGPRVGQSVRVRITGIGVLGSELQQNEAVVVPAPAADQLVSIGSKFALRLEHGLGDIDSVATAIEQRFGLTPDGQTANAHEQVQRAVRPYVIALTAYAVIAALLGLALVAQGASRQTRADADESALLHAIGVTHWQRRARLLGGIVIAAIAGTLAAVSIAFAASAWTPIGPVGPFEPDSGFDADLTVLVLGAVGWIALTSAAGLAGIVVADRARTRTRVPSDLALTRRLPLTTATALRFTRPASAGVRGNGARSAVAGVAISMLVLTTVLTFAAGLNRLVDTPRLYGWTFDASLFLGFQGEDEQKAAAAEVLVPQLAGEPAVAGVTEIAGSDQLTVDGQQMTVTGTAGAGGAFTMTSGHPPSAPDEVVLGPDTATTNGSAVRIEPPDGGEGADYTVVGRAVFPDSGGDGVWLTLDGLHRVDPAAVASQLGVRFKPGTSLDDKTAVIERAGATAAQFVPDATLELPVPPTDTDGLVGIDRLPALLGLALGLAALVTIAHALLLALRARRRYLATLRTFGYSRRQVWTTVLWQSVLITTAGVVIGLPLGLTLGRRLWTSWAGSVGVVDSAVSPLVVLAVLAVTAVAAALVVAIVPAHRAATTRVVEVLHTE